MHGELSMCTCLLRVYFHHLLILCCFGNYRITWSVANPLDFVTHSEEMALIMSKHSLCFQRRSDSQLVGSLPNILNTESKRQWLLSKNTDKKYIASVIKNQFSNYIPTKTQMLGNCQVPRCICFIDKLHEKKTSLVSKSLILYHSTLVCRNIHSIARRVCRKSFHLMSFYFAFTTSLLFLHFDGERSAIFYLC